MKFQKANKKQSKLRLALFGPSGSGKTYSALRIASGMGKKIAVIDTERGSASKYADRFEFDVCEPEAKTIEAYIAAMDMAIDGKYEVLIIDSLTHAWQELLEEINLLANSKFKGNTWSAWSEGTPKQNKLVDAILDFPGHIIATMRSKTEWTTSVNDRGKSSPIRVGLAPEQGKGIEYEFDMLMELSVEHIVNVIKDRTGKYQDKNIQLIDEKFGKELLEWLNDGLRVATESQLSKIKAYYSGDLFTKEEIATRRKDFMAMSQSYEAAEKLIKEAETREKQEKERLAQVEKEAEEFAKAEHEHNLASEDAERGNQ